MFPGKELDIKTCNNWNEVMIVTRYDYLFYKRLKQILERHITHNPFSLANAYYKIRIKSCIDIMNIDETLYNDCKEEIFLKKIV